MQLLPGTGNDSFAVSTQESSDIGRETVIGCLCERVLKAWFEIGPALPIWWMSGVSSFRLCPVEDVLFDLIDHVSNKEVEPHTGDTAPTVALLQPVKDRVSVATRVF